MCLGAPLHSFRSTLSRYTLFAPLSSAPLFLHLYGKRGAKQLTDVGLLTRYVIACRRPRHATDALRECSGASRAERVERSLAAQLGELLGR
ncbi:hypothetical protein B296_00015093 [Ensete ventricosum]|uniref:Uncharacterized protein n=1 Tax=Ensete ventricosum TaxID=4639 RepID=A0A426XEB9_ENSVE|nr:hypothetical protein B296_00015093 [Ensete ventricosum]